MLQKVTATICCRYCRLPNNQKKMPRNKIQLRIWLNKPIDENKLAQHLIQLHWDTSDINRHAPYQEIEVRQYNNPVIMIDKRNDLIP